MTFVFLHAFPLDGRMWQTSTDLWPDAYAPTLYGLGDTMTTWAARVLAAAPRGPLTLVGCSMGGSCALEVTRLAPDRVRALLGPRKIHLGEFHEVPEAGHYVNLDQPEWFNALLNNVGP